MTSSDPQASPATPKPQAASKGGSVGTMLLVGTACVAGAYATGVLGTENRYPIRVEYELARACVDGGEARLPYETYLAKQERCLCTLEETIKKVSYDKYKKSASEFVSAFREAAPACKGKGRS